jgi:hypothetical protein
MTATFQEFRIVRHAMLLAFIATCSCALQADGRKSVSLPTRLFAQKVVDDTLAMHPEIQSLELAAIPPDKTECVTIASNDALEIGEKCDREELAAFKSGEPFVKKEKEDGKEIYQAILSIHDSVGGIIAIAGMDFKPRAGQERTGITERAKLVARELESQIVSKEKMFESVK